MSPKPFLLLLLLSHAATPLRDFISEYFLNEPVVFFASSFHNLNDRLSFILHLNHVKVVLTGKKELVLQEFNNYVMAESNLTSFQSSLEYVRRSSGNTRGRFLVILQNDATEDEIKSVLETSWHYYFYNVVVYANWSVFFTWFPYNPESQCGTVINLRDVKSLMMSPYEDKIPEDLRGCPVNVTWDELALSVKNPFDEKDPGYSVVLLNIVAERMNARLEYLKEIVRYTTPNKGNFTLSVVDYMVQKDIDVAFMTLAWPMSMGPLLEISIAYEDIRCFFVLPPRRKIINSTNIVALFSIQTWSFIIASLITMTLLWKIVTKKSLEMCVFEIFGLFLLQSTITTPPRTSLRRLILLIFFFYVCNLNWTYVSQMSGVLSKPSFEPRVTTIKQLALSTKKLKYADVWEYYFAGRPIYENLLNLRTESLNGQPFQQEFDGFIKNLDYGIIISDTRIRFFKNPKKLHLVSQEQITALGSYFMFKKGFPFLAKFNRVLARVVESGLVPQLVYQSEVSVNKTIIPDYEDVEGYLDLGRVLSAFVLLAIGLGVALVAFVVEVLYAKMYISVLVPGKEGKV